MPQLSLSSYAVYIISVNETLLGKWERVGVEHLFLALGKVANFDRQDSDMIVSHMGKGNADVDEVQDEFEQLNATFSIVHMDPNKIRYGLRQDLGQGELRHEKPVLHRTDACRQVYREAERLARGTGAMMVKPIHLLWAVFKDDDNPATKFIRKQGFDIKQLIAGCQEIAKGKESPAFEKKERKEVEKERSKTQLLDRIGRDLTALADEGKLPIVIGRKEEIRQVIRGLLRADKNGVVLIGDPGVGKTCIVEGLAQLLASGRISKRLEKLKDKRIVEISASSLLSGTKYRGEFEERMEQLIKECEENKDSIILFVDEIHTLMGAGKGSDGAMDAGNILKRKG